MVIRTGFCSQVCLILLLCTALSGVSRADDLTGIKKRLETLEARTSTVDSDEAKKLLPEAQGLISDLDMQNKRADAALKAAIATYSEAFGFLASMNPLNEHADCYKRVVDPAKAASASVADLFGRANATKTELEKRSSTYGSIDGWTAGRGMSGTFEPGDNGALVMDGRVAGYGMNLTIRHSGREYTFDGHIGGKIVFFKAEVDDAGRVTFTNLLRGFGLGRLESVVKPDGSRRLEGSAVSRQVDLASKSTGPGMRSLTGYAGGNNVDLTIDERDPRHVHSEGHSVGYGPSRIDFEDWSPGQRLTRDLPPGFGLQELITVFGVDP